MLGLFASLNQSVCRAQPRNPMCRLVVDSAGAEGGGGDISPSPASARRGSRPRSQPGGAGRWAHRPALLRFPSRGADGRPPEAKTLARGTPTGPFWGPLSPRRSGLEEGLQSAHSERLSRSFHGGPAAKTWPSTAEVKGLVPGRGAKIPHASWPKYQNPIKNRTNVVTNSVKTFKKWSRATITTKKLKKKNPLKLNK